MHDLVPSISSVMIVMNDKILDAHSVEPALIRVSVRGDEGPSQCEGSSFRTPSHQGSPDNSHRQFTSLPMNCQSTFPRRAQDQYSAPKNRKGSLACEDSAKHSREGNISSEEAEMKNHKRKLNHNEGSDINLAKLPRTCHNSDARLENGNMQVPLDTKQLDRKETPLPRHELHKQMEEMGQVVCDDRNQSKTSPQEEQFVENMASLSQEFAGKKKNDGLVELKPNCCRSEKRLVQSSWIGDDNMSIHKNSLTFRNHLEDIEKSPVTLPMYNPKNENWRDSHRLIIGQDDQKMDIMKGPLQSSFAGQVLHCSNVESKGLLSLLSHSGCNKSPGQEEGNARDALCKVSTTSIDSLQLRLSSQQNLQLPLPEANTADKSEKTLLLNKNDPLSSYNASRALEGTWHPLYSSAVSSAVCSPMLASHVSTGMGASSYSHLNTNFPHLSTNLPSGNPSSLSSVFTIKPQLDSTYSSSLGPQLSAYSCYHPKHLQASSQAQLTTAYGQLNPYPMMWQNVNMDIHSEPRLPVPHQGYVNEQSTINMGLLNPWYFHQYQNQIADNQPAGGQFASKSNSKELLAASSSKARSTYFYREDINGTELCGDFLHPFPHSLKVQSTPGSKADIQPVSEVQLCNKYLFKQNLGSHDPMEVRNDKRDNSVMVAETRDMKPLSLAQRNEQKTKSGEHHSVSPNPRPSWNSKVCSTSALDLTLLKYTSNFASKVELNTQHQLFANDGVQRDLNFEATSLYSAVDDTILQQSSLRRLPRETAQKMKDHDVQYKTSLSMLQQNSLDSKETFQDLSCGYLEEKYDLAKVQALPLLAAPVEIHHPRQHSLIMPTLKAPTLTKIPKDDMNIDSNGNCQHGRLEPEQTSDFSGISNKTYVCNQIPTTPCPRPSAKQITLVPQMELGAKINKGTYTMTEVNRNIHQEANTGCTSFNNQCLSSSPTPTPTQSNQSLGRYKANLSPLNDTLNTKRISHVTSPTDYYTPKKYKASRTETPCSKKLSNECLHSAGEMRTSSVKKDTNSPEILPPSVSLIKQLSSQNTSSAGPSLRSNLHNCHTKLKKAWLTRHSAQDNTRKQQESHGDENETLSGRNVSKGLEIEPAALLNNSNQKEESIKRLAAKMSCDSEYSDLAENRHWLRTRREGKLANQHKSGQALEEKVRNSSKEDEELRGDRTLSRKLDKESGHVQNDQSDVPLPMLIKSAGDSFLQDVPCTELFTNIPRCRDCWPSRTRKGQDFPPLYSSCRFMHLRRLSVSRNGGLKVEGFSTEDQVNEEAPLEPVAHATGTVLDPETSAYILTHVGDPFCELVLAEQRLLKQISESYDGAIACKAAFGEKEETCDSCHSVVFNLHWICPRCGFFVCMDCFDLKHKKSVRNEKERGEDVAAWLKCVKGQNHDIKSLRPTQLVPNSALMSLCEKMHSSKKRLGIKSNCTCVDGDMKCPKKASGMSNSPKSQAKSNVELTHSLTAREESAKSTSTAELSQESSSNHVSSSSQSPLHWLAELASQKAKQEANEVEEAPYRRYRNASVSSSLTDQRARSTEQSSTLCDLLTTTAGKLRLGSTDAGIAFAPVYTTLSNCNMAKQSMPNILDDIIASVVEQKIPITKSPRQSKEGAVPKQTQEEDAKSPHSWLSKGICPWFQSPNNKKNWKLFQEYWIKGLPVIVSGVLTATDSNSWTPECLKEKLGEQSVSLVNCRDQSVLTRARSKEFWQGFKTNSDCHRPKSRGTKILRLDYCTSEKEFNERMPAQFDELHRHLPLPEYTRNDGKLNLVSRFPEETAKSQLELRVCSVYGLRLDDGNAGSTSLRLELTDTIHVLVHAEPLQEDRDALEKVILAGMEGDIVDDAAMRRLKDSSERPGALWHIYSSQDTDRIRKFLQKVADEGDTKAVPGQDQICRQRYYLDQVLRTRLFEECGIRSRVVLQFGGDAVLIPAATSYQVHYFTNCITVTKAFVSSEHVRCSLQRQPISERESWTAEMQKLQMKTLLYNTVKDCVHFLHVVPVS
ncbi:probable JmjC domain-containing histone demethylation protein 2C isoform X1 [Carcharodon carcharias]|uniref:probable JmjC domain-containing histone demethylation protein 2C isoform X1 n=2 Tax=Carcharodon carcharias TaxID=13397 RepID=UPI001B7F6320|nr:probable JmjC domain-containing histone demethylation protein 2C isoform X1 [Carcharodon carcharias]XP_041066042.1 probable JmjC domain-containing histone demethylation protein 2C isoform X1 [Carcharodon carcharias]XP_041066043.1 probable JmjC domain-containing histone demethylation protein 2C isoform X1 [Carcharodon carcharias]